jgi:O-antigen/teichoic acid export membrane protein
VKVNPAAAAAPDPSDDSEHVMTLYGQAMVRSGAVLAIGMIGIIPFGLISVAVTTRYLDIAEFGELSVLIAISSLVTMLAGAGFLQGAIMTAFGIADDGEGGSGAVDVDDNMTDQGGPIAASEERRRLLGSGLLIVVVLSAAMCAAVGAVGVVVVDAWAQGFSHAAILWMAASAWSGSIWRFVHQVPRMERRPVRWSILSWVRPALVVAAIVIVLSSGGGIAGVLMAMAAGTSLSALVAYAISAPAFRFAPRRGDIRTLWEVGKVWIPLSVAAAVQINASILVLGALASPTSVGLFQVATRIAQLPAYFAEGFLLAWPAMERSPISFAAKDRRGTRDYEASVFTLFALSTLGLFVVLCLAADSLVHIAAPSYRSASSLIPLVAASFAALAMFRGLFRATSFPLRRYWFTLLHFLWVAPYAALVAVLIPWDANYGVAIAQIVAFASVCVAYLMIDKRGPNPTPFQWKRLGLALLAASAVVAMTQLAPDSPMLHAVLAVSALVAFPSILVAAGVIPRAQISVVAKIVGAIVPKPLPKRVIAERIRALPDHERGPVTLTVCARRASDDAARALGVSPEILHARMVRGLRRFADAGPPSPLDHKIGEYLLSSGTSIERDALARHLHQMGVDQLHLHVLDDVRRTVSRARNRVDSLESTRFTEGSI